MAVKYKIHIFERRVRESINERKSRLCTQLKALLKETVKKFRQSTAHLIEPQRLGIGIPFKPTQVAFMTALVSHLLILSSPIKYI